METIGRSYSRHFSAFMVDDNPLPMPAQPVHQPRPSRPVMAPTAAALSQSQRRPRTLTDEDIPVLEGAGSVPTTAFYSDDDDDDDDDDEEDDDDEDDDADDDDDELDATPVLQSAEDAKRSTLAAAPGKENKPSRRKRAKGTLRKLRDVASVRRSPKRGDAEPTPTSASTAAPVASSHNHNHNHSHQQHRMTEHDRQLPRTSSSMTTFNTNIGSESFVASSRASLAAPSADGSKIGRQIIRQGWLVRQGQHLKTWKRRYFLLFTRTNSTTHEITATLQYFKGNVNKVRGEIHFQEANPIKIRFVDVSESKKPFCFEISQGDFTLMCQGKDDEDVSAWVWYLQSLSPLDGVGVGSSSTSSFSTSRSTLSAITAVPSLGDRGIYIIAELRRLLHNSKSPEATKCKNFVKDFECRSASSLRQLRDLHAAVTDSIMRVHGARIIAMTEEKAAQAERSRSYHSNGSSRNGATEPLKLHELRAITSRHVEDVLYGPLQESIATFLREAFGDDDAALNRKLRWLQGKDQTYYNIPLHQVSWKEWRKASKILSQAAHAPGPTQKYEVLVAAMKEIQLTYAEEHDQLVESENPLETDDLIPIFTFVLANSGLDNLLSMKLLLSELNGSWAVGGSLDSGAALSILKYAIDFISNVSIPAMLEDIFKDQVTLSIDGEWRQVLDVEVEPTYRYGAVIRQISPYGASTIGSSIARGHVLVTVNGQNVVLWPYTTIASLLKESTPPHRLAFIPSNSYFKILTSNKALWNVALTHACQRGDIASVQMLLANGADVNYVSHEIGGNTPLHIAVSALHFNVVSYLLQHGAKAKALGEYGRTALHMVGRPCKLPSLVTVPTVTTAGNSLRSKLQPGDKVVMIIRKLINHDTPTDSPDIFGLTPLMLLAQRGFVNGVDVLVECTGGNMDLNVRNWQHGLGALALAAREGHQDVVEALLDYGAQPDLCDLRGDTPLHFAAAAEAKDICRVLVERECHVDVRNRAGVTPLMMAASKGRDPLPAAKSTRHAQKKSSTRRVDSASTVETIELLLAAGADLYTVCDQYRLPLHYAALHGGPEVYKFLLGKMTSAEDALQRDLFGVTAAAMALENHQSGTWSSDGNDPVDESDNSVRESLIESQSDFQLLVSSSSGRVDEKTERQDDLVFEISNGSRLMIAGSLAAICDEIYSVDDYKIDDAAALVSTCTVSSYRALLDYLRGALQQAAGDQERSMHVRRMVLHSVDLMVQSFLQKVELDTEICNCIHDFCTELFPFKLDDDPFCGQWLATSQLPMFAESVRMQRLYDLRISSPCEAAYSSLKAFLNSAKKTNPALKFLDDDLFTSTFGVEVISESMRRRLSIAGVWNGDASKSFLVRADPSESPSLAAASTRKTLASIPLARARSTVAERSGRVWLFDVQECTVAYQITLFQHYLFSQIRVSEILESKRSAEKTPAYDRLRQLHNHISIWVVNQILSREDADQRAQVLAHFIKVAGVCLHPLQNFDGFMAIMNATNDSSIFRLKKTWNRLPAQTRDQWHELKKHTESGARSIHKLMRDAIPPMVPYVGAVMQNIIAVQEFPDRVEGDLINFKKIRLLGGVVKRFTTLQASPYLLQVDKRVLDQLCASLPYADADACFSRSLKVEPRIPTS